MCIISRRLILRPLTLFQDVGTYLGPGYRMIAGVEREIGHTILPVTPVDKSLVEPATGRRRGASVLDSRSRRPISSIPRLWAGAGVGPGTKRRRRLCVKSVERDQARARYRGQPQRACSSLQRKPCTMQLRSRSISAASVVALIAVVACGGASPWDGPRHAATDFCGGGVVS